MGPKQADLTRSVLCAAALVLTSACAAAINYTDPSGPSYSGSAASVARDADTLRVVVFNVEYAYHTGLAATLLLRNAALRGADIVLLQEMDEKGAAAIADSLGMGFVYFPSTLHPVTNRDFGNAVLSRYPIENARKIILPYLARFRRTQRAAVGATVMVGTRRVRVYSVHIATFVGNGPGERRAQLRAILADADSFSTVVMGGDFNSATVPEIALERGFTWPTRHLGRTEAFWSMDHILLKGLTVAGSGSTGLVRDNGGASDHKPVWARIVVPTRDSSAAH